MKRQPAEDERVRRWDSPRFRSARGGARSAILAWLLFSAFAHPAAGANVAVLLSADVEAYQEAVLGFLESLDHKVVARFDMKGDFDRGRRLLREIETDVQPDLVLAVGLWALQLMAQEQPAIPVVYTMVLNPPSVLGSESSRITGASLNVPVERALRLLKQLGPNVRRVGIVFDPAHTGYLVERAQSAAEAVGLELVTEEAHSSGDAVAALETLQASGVDALWIVPDETLLAPAVLEHILLFSYRNGIPILGLSPRHAEMGALASVSFGSSEDIGRQAGELANQILEGRLPSELPYTTARKVHVTVNLKAARKLGLEISESFLSSATAVID